MRKLCAQLLGKSGFWGMILLLNNRAVNQSEMSISLKPEYLIKSKGGFGLLRRIFMCAELLWNSAVFNKHLACLSSSGRVRINSKLKKEIRKSVADTAAPLFSNSPSIHGLCRFLDLLTISFSCSSCWERCAVLRRAHKFSTGFRSAEEAGRVIILSSWRSLLACPA